jgi:hypothetical protein
MISGDYSTKECSGMLEALNLEKIQLPYKNMPEALIEKYGENPEFFYYKSGNILCRSEHRISIDYARIDRDSFWSRKISIVCSFYYKDHVQRVCDRSKIPNLTKIYSKFYGITPLPPKVIS